MRTCYPTTVIIDEQPCLVHLAKTGGTTWTAYGDVQGVRVTATGRSEAQALSGWRRHANYQANA